jgi:isoquinoline 1-oxidoreductase subunit beta
MVARLFDHEVRHQSQPFEGSARLGTDVHQRRQNGQQLRRENAGEREYGWMFTGNSESSSTFYPIMRIMGAAARELLVQVAAKRLNIDATNLVVRDGIIADPASGRSLGFGALAAEAATLPVPEAPRLKSNSELKLIGRPLARLDVPGKTDGSAVFGIDVRVPGMAIAAIRRAPSPGGKLVSYDRSRILAHREQSRR